ncbi:MULTISPECIES: outer membrane lipoprotein chaperone LolA [Giesbergeria]|uniref:Outer-membrane lipoprotein carrier protein n=1 Tax=Giesbergeria sinuosa TaxID=80883 RepID=A0ABV9QB86_9BURK
MKKILTAFVLLVGIPSAMADGLKSLDVFLRGTQTGRADFTQVVTSPGKDGQAARSKTSSGTFEFQRPGRFRFVYQKPFLQTIVADGQSLWLYDADLNQVTQRAQAQALGSAPAALLAAAPDLKALRMDFLLEVSPAPQGEENLEWVLARPKSKEGQLQSVRIGFAGEQLAALEILDSFGQRSMIRFSQVQTNPVLPAATFQFKPPAGADVLRQ